MICGILAGKDGERNGCQTRCTRAGSQRAMIQRGGPAGGHGPDGPGLNPLSLPICLEFGPVLEVLAEAGWASLTNGWSIQPGQQDRAAGIGCGGCCWYRLCSQLGSRHEPHSCAELYVWAREHGGEAHGSRLGVELPNGACYAPERPGCPRNNWRTTRLRAGHGCCVSALTSWWR